MIERAVVFPKLRITGRFDRIGRIVDEFFIVDVKTGINAIRYPKSTAIQLAMYGNAPLIAVHGVDEEGNFETEEFLPMPPVNKRIAYVVYLDPDEGEYQVHSVNIRLGWQAVQQVILPALRWRDVNDRALVKRVA
jgi:RecB family exonuclease